MQIRGLATGWIRNHNERAAVDRVRNSRGLCPGEPLPDALTLLLDHLASRHARCIWKTDRERSGANIEVGNSDSHLPGQIEIGPVIRDRNAQRRPRGQPPGLAFKKPLHHLRRADRRGQRFGTGGCRPNAASRGTCISGVRSCFHSRRTCLRSLCCCQMAQMLREVAAQPRMTVIAVPIPGGILHIAKNEPGTTVRAKPIIDDLPVIGSIIVIPRRMMKDHRRAVGCAGQRRPVDVLLAIPRVRHTARRIRAILKCYRCAIAGDRPPHCPERPAIMDVPRRSIDETPVWGQ